MADREPTRQDMANEATRRFEAGDHAAAQRLCRQILDDDPKQSQVLTLLGASELATGRIGEAVAAFENAVEVDPDNAVAQQHLDTIARDREAATESPYFKEYMALRPIYMDYPRRISIETVGRCNATCDFCPQGELDRRFTGMPDELFDKVIADLKDIPTDVPITIMPNLVNEPFMDRQMLDRLQTINRELPQADLHIFTNFNVLPSDFFERIPGIANLNTINVSFNAANQEEYERVMGIDFARTIDNLSRFMALNRERKVLSGPFILSRVADLTERDDAFAPQCRKLFPDFAAGEDYRTHVKNRTDWLGSIATEQSQIPYTLPCGAWFDINVFCTGLVPHCCMDAKGDYAIGDVTRASLLEIYNSPRFRTYRETLTSRETAHPCNRCALLQ
jgi:hypothetical protein